MALPIINLSLLPVFPANVVASPPIVISKSGLTYAFSMDYGLLGQNLAPVLTDTDVVSYDRVTGAMERIPVANIAPGLTITSSQISDSTATGRSVLTGSASAGRTALGLGDVATLNVGNGLTNDAGSLKVQIGTVVQAWDADLDALGALSGTNNIYYRSGAATWSSVTISTGLTFTAGALSWNGFNARKNSTGSVFTRRRLNLIEGTGIAITMDDDAPNDEVDVTISATASSNFAPLPKSAAGIGQWTDVTSTAGGSWKTPAGGTWAYFFLIYNNSTGVWAGNARVGVAAGGTTVETGTTNIIYTGLAWRIA